MSPTPSSSRRRRRRSNRTANGTAPGCHRTGSPSAYRQCTATGTLASTASRPDHTCAVPIQDGALSAGNQPVHRECGRQLEERQHHGQRRQPRLDRGAAGESRDADRKESAAHALCRTHRAPTATSAPSATAISTATPDARWWGLHSLRAQLGSDIASPLHTNRRDLDAVDDRNAVGRQPWARARSTRPPAVARRSLPRSGRRSSCCERLRSRRHRARRAAGQRGR